MSRTDTEEINKVFHPHVNFFDLKIVRCTLYSTAAISLILSILILCTSSHLITLDMSFEGVNYLFFTVLRLPLGVLALLIPLLAIYAASHRSEQSRETMRLTRSQNNFSNYYKHLEEFLKYMESEVRPAGIVTDHRRVHDLLFPYALAEGISINEDWVERFGKRVSVFLDAVAPMLSGESGLRHQENGVKMKSGVEYVPMEYFLSETLQMLGDRVTIDRAAIKPMFWSVNSDGTMAKLSRYHFQIECLRNLNNYLTTAVAFDAQYSSPLPPNRDRFNNLLFREAEIAAASKSTNPLVEKDFDN